MNNLDFINGGDGVQEKQITKQITTIKNAISINNPLAYYGSLANKNVSIENKYFGNKDIKTIPIKFEHESSPILISPSKISNASITINDLNRNNKKPKKKNIDKLKVKKNYFIEKYGLNNFTLLLLKYKRSLILSILLFIVSLIVIIFLFGFKIINI